MKCCRKTVQNHRNAFFILNNDIFFGQQALATSGEIGSPYPTHRGRTFMMVASFCVHHMGRMGSEPLHAQRLEFWAPQNSIFYLDGVRI